MVTISVYGAEVICASCVGMPSSKETFDWLQAAIARKYPENNFQFQYIDIFKEQKSEEIEAFAQRVRDEELFYPVVLVNRTVVGEGNPRLKAVYEEIERNL